VRRALSQRRPADALGVGAVLVALFATGVWFLVAHGAGGASAAAAGAGQLPTTGEVFNPELGLPATDVVAFGVSPQEAPGEVWAYGRLGYAPVTVAGQRYSEQDVLLERSEASGWQVVPLPPGPEGKPLTGPGGESDPAAEYGALAGQATAAGGVVLLAGQQIVVRDPGGQPRLVTTPGAIGGGGSKSSGEVLAEGESLLPKHASGGNVTVPYAAIEENSGGTGVLIAPSDDGGDPTGEPKTQPGVLHYDGEVWTRESIELPRADADDFTALALACGGTATAPTSSSPHNCWLLADASVASAKGAQTELLLFEREPSEEPDGYTWEREPVSDWLLGEAAPPSGVSERVVAPLAGGAQMLTVTAQGAWVDFQTRVNGQSAPIDVSELVTPGSGSASGSPLALPPAYVVGTWCYPTGIVCSPEHTLGAELPAHYRSFAWPAPTGSPSGAGGDPGSRIVTGLHDRALLELGEAGGGFAYTIGPGGESGSAPGGAAFSAPTSSSPARGWIADGIKPADDGADGEGQSQAIEVSPQPMGDQLQEEAVPFRRPLLAVAQAPGTALGTTSAEAIAVGVEGQVAHYSPSQGWRPESLYDSAGKAQTPNLRGVAWPEPTRAYAVGDEGAMWLWRSETGLWEPDPSRPFNFIGNLTAIAFSPTNSQRGYAVGKQGVLLRYGKSWEQEALPVDLQQANFTSVAFAGEEALATFRVVEAEADGTEIESGGLAVEDGSGWQVDPGVTALLEQLPSPREQVLSKVAGLPDGGAVAAGPGLVIERESPSAPWQFPPQPLPEAQNVSALGAYREGSSGPVRAVVSMDLNLYLNPQTFDGSLASGEGPYSGDYPTPTGSGQPTPFIAPDPLPDSGYVLQETAGGWVDMEHEALPAVSVQPADMPIRPDPVLALLVNPTGGSMLAVGGQTGDATGSGPEPADETAAALRFPAAAASTDGASSATVQVPAGKASFVIAGQATCAQPCADFADESLGPDVWLEHALRSANAIAATAPSGAVRAFLYTGERLRGASTSGEAFERELARYAELLGSGGSLPVYAADSADVAPAGMGDGPFARILAPFAPGGGGAGGDYYEISSTGSSGGLVRVLVLDFSTGALGASQETWLERELLAAREAGTPAVVMGSDSLGFVLPDQGGSGGEATDAAAVSKILVEDGASAYFFHFPGGNVKASVDYGAASIPAYGSGTLGYVPAPGQYETDSLGSSGFLLASVETAARNRATNVAPVSAEVVPNISQLALDATDGVLLRRSQVGLFEALARRPPAGEEAAGASAFGGESFAPDPYDPIPFNCQGPNCAYEVPTEYTFSSSNPDIGNFVEHEAGSSNPRQVQLGANKLPIPDSHSGLFCAYNEGTTTVSITTGGLTYSEPITVQGGSVEYPCGTVPLKNPPQLPAAVKSAISLPDLAPSSPPPVSPLIQTVPPPPPPAPAKPPHQPQPLSPELFPFISFAPSPLGARPAILPPISPPVARPIPPSSTSQVYQDMAVPESEREREPAGELASNDFSAYDPNEGGWPGLWIVPLAILAAGAGVGIRRGTRTGRRRPALARARVKLPTESSRGIWP
jgi:hypothetical protein